MHGMGGGDKEVETNEMDVKPKRMMGNTAWSNSCNFFRLKCLLNMYVSVPLIFHLFKIFFSIYSLFSIFLSFLSKCIKKLKNKGTQLILKQTLLLIVFHF